MRGGRARARRRAAPRLPRARPPGDRAFGGAPQHHYLVRSVDPVDPPLAVPHAAYVTGARAVRRGRRARAAGAAPASRSSSPRTAAATRPTARSPRRARSASTVIMMRRPPLPRGAGGRDGRRGDRLARSCAHLGRGARRVDQRRPARPRDHARLARADDDERRHVGRGRVGLRRASSRSMRSSARPTARPKITGVDAGRCRRSRSKAAPSCQGRAREIGL